MTISLEEHIARAIFRKDEDCSDEWLDGWWPKYRDHRHQGDCSLAEPELRGPVTCGRCVVEHYLVLARAAIAAVREREGAEEKPMLLSKEELAGNYINMGRPITPAEFAAVRAPDPAEAMRDPMMVNGTQGRNPFDGLLAAEAMRVKEAAALIVLAKFNIPTDVQELLVQGNPMRSVAPGALRAALKGNGEGR